LATATKDRTKYVYFFGDGDAEGGTELVDLLGGKGSNLAEMSRIGVPVPPGFTLSTEVCRQYFDNEHNFPEGLESTVDEYLERVESLMGKQFGDSTDPLLLSVRSGAPVSMPGMMDTVLNLGLNDQTVQGLSNQTDDPRFAYDSYRRFVQMYGDVVKGIEGDRFEDLITEKKNEIGVEDDTDLTADDWKDLVDSFKDVYQSATGEEFPEDPVDQLWGAIRAVFESWDNERAIKWREINDLPHDVGTAVNIQTMVFGNLGETSATGVAFTRDSATGEKQFNGEFLPNAQGEDVVAGVRTPQPLNEYERQSSDKDLPTLQETMTEAYEELKTIFRKLERHYKDMQDVEFTIQEGEVYLLQTRTGKRTADAMVKIAHDMAEEGIIDRRKAVDRIDADRLDQVLHPQIKDDQKESHDKVAEGLGASPGGATGKIVFNADEAEKLAEQDEKVLLVRHETSPEDIGGMNVAEGILTSRGGRTSHAAVVARGMGKPCVAGCNEIEIDYDEECFRVGDHELRKGDWISLDGTTGEVYSGQLAMEEPELTEEFENLMSWADQFRELNVRTNADNGEDSELARQFGAEGIGLCRTEHMFFEEDRIDRVREMILRAPDVQQLRLERDILEKEVDSAPPGQIEEKQAELSELKEELKQVEDEYRDVIDSLKPEQRKDFLEVFESMDGFPVTVRLLDPPLHEFLPEGQDELSRVAERLGISNEEVKTQIEKLTEDNPMLGHRGCRLGVSYPEVYYMQTRAIIEAAVEADRDGIDVKPEIMIPLVSMKQELSTLREAVDKAAQDVLREENATIDYKIGTMIELPRAALVADEIAEYAEFFSFGTNDLTQTTYGISRDDANLFLDYYHHEELLEEDPFQVLDRDGVGELVQIGVERGRQTRSGLKVGICGEHGGDPSSVEFFHESRLDYVSCSPYRVPTARIAAAKAAIDAEEDVSSY
jgi:pyruvate,orthophosphate dikinase